MYQNYVRVGTVGCSNFMRVLVLQILMKDELLTAMAVLTFAV